MLEIVVNTFYLILPLSVLAHLTLQYEVSSKTPSVQHIKALMPSIIKKEKQKWSMCCQKLKEIQH